MSEHRELEKALNWVLNHSLQTGILVLLVLLVQWIFRRQLTNRWRFALWWVVLLRLMLPFSPQSAVSLFNYFHASVGLADPRYYVPAQTDSIAPQPAPQQSGELAPLKLNQEPAQIRISPSFTASVPIMPVISPPSLNSDDFLILGAVGLWMAGALGLCGVVASQVIRFRRKLATASAPADPTLQTLLDDCRREFRLSGPIEVLETDAVESPALFGLLRPRLLVPQGIGTQFAARELRYIFLHELAHVKRRDLWLNWLVTALQIVHWFNPVLWFGFARLRADRELACDELALLQSGDHGGVAYGETVVKLLEKLNRPAAIPGLVGILEDRSLMRRRISMIANFRRPGRWSVLAGVLAAALAVVALTDAISKPVESEKRPDLTGHVFGKGETPLPVAATVFIATAAPKTGTSTLCPSCYADCVKHARTDAAGGFKIKSLDPHLTFQILAVATGYQPKHLSKVDPSKGDPVKFELTPIESIDAAPDRSLRGRVVNPKGAPIEGAIVEVRGLETKDGGGRWGSLPGIDPIAVTDQNGDFLITSKKPFDMLAVKVSARMYAGKNFRELASGAKPHELVLTEGTTLTGHVLRQGKPLEGVTVGVSASDREAGVYLGHFEVSTEADGGFSFFNIPPDTDFQVYTLMDTMKNNGAVPLLKIHTAKDGETTKVGDLIAGAGFRLAGRVELSDGQRVPPDTRLHITREGAWDSTLVPLGPDGTFAITDIPGEIIGVGARVPGYHFSSRNVSLDTLNLGGLVGRVDHDITNLIFLLDKGPGPRPDYGHIDPEYDQLRQHSLTGAEGIPDHSHELVVTGSVLDSATHQSVENFRVTPGELDNFDDTSWFASHTTEGVHGLYHVSVSKLSAQPLLKVEAEGYLPQSVKLLPGDTTPINFILTKGSGPAGFVLDPDGRPAAGATVLLENDGRRPGSLSSAGELSGNGNDLALGHADAQGKFGFKPLLGISAIVAASPDGFAVVSAERFATNSTITLEKYAELSGTLMRDSKPGTNETLGVKFYDIKGTHPFLSMQAATDAAGHFDLGRVPAGSLQIFARRPVLEGRRTWTQDPLKEVDSKPGQKLVVNIVAKQNNLLEAKNNQRRPRPQPIPGAHLKGIVLGPDGKPASEAQVALQVDSIYLGLGAATFTGNPDDGVRVRASEDGSFTLPLYEGARSIVALNDDGYAQIPIEQFKASLRIKLQRWARIEGVLRLGHHLATNERVLLAEPPPRWSTLTVSSLRDSTKLITVTNSEPNLPRPHYDPNAFEVRTDDHGRFVFNYVPPDKQVLAVPEPLGAHSWTQKPLATVELKPGELLATNIGGNGRAVIVKLKFPNDEQPDLKNGTIGIFMARSEGNKKMSEIKTDAELKKYLLSAEYRDFTDKSGERNYSALALRDGSFRLEDVVPGKYGVCFQENPQPGLSGSPTRQFFVAPQEFIVPEAANRDDDSVVDLGTVQLNKESSTRQR